MQTCNENGIKERKIKRKKEHSEENKNSTDLLEYQFKQLLWKAEQKN